MLILFQSTFQDPQLDTHNLYITDGTETVSLVDTNVYLLDYTPRTPSRSGGVWQDVTESASVLFQADTSAAIQVSINEIERLLYQGEMRQSNPAQERVFVVQQLASESGTWRSEILSGRVELDDDTWRHWNVRSVEAQIIWTRRYFWEGAEAEVGLAVAADLDINGDIDAGDFVTGGVAVDNCGSASWWETATVSGAIPAGVRLVVQPVSYQICHYFTLGHSVGTGGNFVHHYQGETDILVGGTTLPGSSTPTKYSGGYYRNRGITATTLTAAMEIVMVTSNINLANGGYFEIITRYINAPPDAGDIKIQARIEYVGIELWRGPEVATNGRISQSLGVVQLPPALDGIGYGDNAGISLIIYARTATGGLEDLSIDYIQFIGAMESRHIAPVAVITGWSSDTYLVDDGITKNLYLQKEINDTIIPAFVGTGSQLTITPGVRNRYWLQSSEVNYLTSSLNETDITYTVRMFYRPRRLTV